MAQSNLKHRYHKEIESKCKKNGGRLNTSLSQTKTMSYNNNCSNNIRNNNSNLSRTNSDEKKADKKD